MLISEIKPQLARQENQKVLQTDGELGLSCRHPVRSPGSSTAFPCLVVLRIMRKPRERNNAEIKLSMAIQNSDLLLCRPAR